MIDYIRERLIKALEEVFCIPHYDAKKFSDGFTNEVRRELGGDEVYIAQHDRESKRRQALEMFNGENHKEVCERCGISRATLYRYLGDRNNIQASGEQTE